MITLTENKDVLQIMIAYDPKDINSHIPFATLFMRVAKTAYIEASFEPSKNMHEPFPKKGYSQIILETPERADAWILKMIELFGTTFSMERISKFSVAMYYRIKEKPSQVFLDKYAHFFNAIAEYQTYGSEQGLPRGEYAVTSVVSEPVLQSVAENNNHGISSANGQNTSISTLGVNSAGALMERGSINESLVSVSVPDFTPIPIGKQEALKNLTENIRHRMLLKVFREYVGPIKSFAPTASQREGAVLYLSTTNRLKLATYAENIGLRHELMGGSHGIVLFGNIPHHADSRLIAVIDEKLGIRPVKQPKVKRIIKPIPRAAGIDKKALPAGELPKLLAVLKDLLSTELANVTALNHLVNMATQASIHQNAEQIAELVAMEIVKKNGDFSFLKSLIQTSIVEWFNTHSAKAMN